MPVQEQSSIMFVIDNSLKGSQSNYNKVLDEMFESYLTGSWPNSVLEYLRLFETTLLSHNWDNHN